MNNNRLEYNRSAEIMRISKKEKSYRNI